MTITSFRQSGLTRALVILVGVLASGVAWSQEISGRGSGQVLRPTSSAPLRQLLPATPVAPGPAVNPFQIQDGCYPDPPSYQSFSGVLLPTPNLDVGFSYSFSDKCGVGRLSGDYLLPIVGDAYTAVFAETHLDYLTFREGTREQSVTMSTSAVPGPQGIDLLETTSRTSTTDIGEKVDLSVGGGFRKLFSNHTMLGINAFFDTSRVLDKWYGSWGAGLEMAGSAGGDGMSDLRFNAYGPMFTKESFEGAIRKEGMGFEFDAGYSYPLFNRSIDLRLNFGGYQLDTGERVYGWKAGVEATTGNGVLTFRYEHGEDKLSSGYNLIGGSVNLVLSFEDLLSARNPISFPQPVFRSERNLPRLLTKKVARNWNQPTGLAIRKSTSASETRPLIEIPSARRTVMLGDLDNRSGPTSIVFSDSFSAVSASDLEGIRRIKVEFSCINSKPDPNLVISFGFTRSQQQGLVPAYPVMRGTDSSHAAFVTGGDLKSLESTRADLTRLITDVSIPSGGVAELRNMSVIISFYR
jgi:hypothetical protein